MLTKTTKPISRKFPLYSTSIAIDAQLPEKELFHVRLTQNIVTVFARQSIAIKVPFCELSLDKSIIWT